MIRIRERVIATLDSPNLDIRTNLSDDDEDPKKEEYSWEMVVSFRYKVEKMLCYVCVIVKFVWCFEMHLIW